MAFVQDTQNLEDCLVGVIVAISDLYFLHSCA